MSIIEKSIMKKWEGGGKVVYLPIFEMYLLQPKMPSQ
jgi:hypothetical protein